MKTLTRVVTPLIAVAMFASTPIMSLAQDQKQDNSANYSADPNGGPEQEQAFKDGQEAAKLDKVANRKIDASASHLYVHPPVKKEKRDAYRDSFKKGYEKAVKDSAGV